MPVNLLVSLLVSAGVAMFRPSPVEADIAWVAEGEFCEPETALVLPNDTMLGNRLYLVDNNRL